VPPDKVGVLTGLDDARFRHPVLPGDQLQLDVRLVKRHRPLWKMQGVARVGGQVVAEATLMLTETVLTRRP
jgi:3-hydroxyacyl-[acyl-carrier-protein] dehydratase